MLALLTEMAELLVVLARVAALPVAVCNRLLATETSVVAKAAMVMVILLGCRLEGMLTRSEGGVTCLKGVVTTLVCVVTTLLG